MIVAAPPVRLSFAILLSGLLALAGCSKAPPATPVAPPVEPSEPKPTASPAVEPAGEKPAGEKPAGEKPAGEKPAGEKPAEPVAPPASASSEDADAAVLARLIETLKTTADSRTRVITIDEIATRHSGALPALPALVAALGDEEPRVRWHAARAIGLVGKEAAGAIPEVLKLLADTDPVVVTQAAAAVGHIRADDERDVLPAADEAVYAGSVEPLLAASVHPDPRVRRAALRSLKRVCRSSDELAAQVVKALGDADPVAVLPALHTLADMEEDAVPFLLQALADPKSRYWAAVTLAEIGAEAAPAVEPLAKLAAEGPIEDRVQAILALAAIGEPARPAVPMILDALGSKDDSLQYVAAFALGRLKAAEAAEAMAAAAASEDDPFLALLASWARAEISPADAALKAEAISRLRAALESSSPDYRKAAIEGLSDLSEGLDPTARGELAEQFVAQLASQDPGVGLAAGGGLIRLGGDAVAALRSRLADPELRGEAMEILAEIGPAAGAALGDMVAGLADPDPVYRGDCALALAAVGPEAAAAVGALTKMLDDEAADAGTRATAAYALGQIGSRATDAEPSLRRLAAGEDELLATVAVWAALKIRPEDRTLFDAAIPKLRHALKQERDVIRMEAAVALGEIGPAAATALPMLEMLAEEDPSRSVREAAAEAVVRIRPPR